MSKYDWKVGDRAQKSEWVDEKEVFHTGAVSDVVIETREKQSYDRWGGSGYGSKKTETEMFVKSITVKWDSGNEEAGLSPWHVRAEDTQLEREFRIKASEVGDLIAEKLALADKALDEAVALANEHGISFSASISPLSQSYKAGSASEKWPDISEEFMNEVTDSHGEYDGWQHSAVC